MTEPDVIPTPTSLPEVGIHLSYIRRDILAVGKTVEEGFKALDDHFVSRVEFKPIAETVANHGKSIGEIKEWKDNLTGRMVGFAIGISAASAGGAAAIIHLLGG